MKRLLYIWLLAALMVSCGDDEQPFPDIVTELADGYTDESGSLCKMCTDQDVTYRITNPVAGLRPSAIYRILGGYTDLGNGAARLYQVQGAYILRDSTDCGVTDPTGVLSAWRAGRYINLHLAPKTQGGKQYWGFLTDSVRPGWAHLSLHHNQLSDPLSYTADVYASLPVDSIKGIEEGDSICLTIRTFDGQKTWRFKK